ncbi:MAG: hypothetical protein HY721_19550 [Planctomycetes bacterium]|nr:hypothetical protein [Planctomycetota bacterium]
MRPSPRFERRGAAAWVLPFGDVMSLLVVLFAFLYVLRKAPLAVAGMPSRRIQRVALAEEEPRRPTKGILEQRSSAAARDARGASLLVSVFFDRGSAEVPEPARRELERLAPALWSFPVPLVAAGYASPLAEPWKWSPPRDAEELGFARAMAVVRILSGEEARLGGAGAGAPRFQPASGGHHGAPVQAEAAGGRDPRDRVDIFPAALEEP